MEENRFPWEMDKPIEEIEAMRKVLYPGDFKLMNYLIARLKKAESERDAFIILDGVFANGTDEIVFYKGFNNRQVFVKKE